MNQINAPGKSGSAGDPSAAVAICRANACDDRILLRRHQVSWTASLSLTLLLITGGPSASAQDAAPSQPARESDGRSRFGGSKAPAGKSDGEPANWPAVSHEDLVHLAKTARRAMEETLSTGRESVGRYQPPGLAGHHGIVHLALRSNGSILAEVETERRPIVEAANLAGVLLAQHIAKNKITLPSQGRDRGLEFEWLGPIEYLDAKPNAEGHWPPDLIHAFEPAAEGIGVEFQGRRGWIRPSEIVTRNYTPDLALAAAESVVGLQVIHKIRLPQELRYFRFPAVHLWQPDAASPVVRLFRGEELVLPEAASRAGLDESIARLRKYLRYMQMTDGGFAEEYQPSSDRIEHGPTPAVQLRGLTALAELSEWTGQASDRERLDRCLDRVLLVVRPVQKATKDEHGKVTIEDVGQALHFPGEPDSVEPTARLLMALRSSRRAGGSDATIQRLARALLASQDDDGRFSLRIDAAEESVSRRGEADAAHAGAWAMLALAMWNANEKNAAASTGLERARVHYQSWQEGSGLTRAGAAAGSVLARALCQVYEQTNDARCSDAAFCILDRLAALQVTPAACPLPELHGAFQTGERGVVGADSALCLTALANGLEVARRIGDRPRAARYEAAVQAGARFILQLQFSESGCFYVRSPRDAAGGIRLSPWDNRVRLDRCGDALISLIHSRQALYGRPDRARGR